MHSTLVCVEALKFPYQRRKPEYGLLFQTIQENTDRYFAEQSARGINYPGFVYQTFKAYLHCGVLDYGFVRTYCRNCKASELIAFSCKRRGFCPSCHSKRMNEASHHLMENVLPEIPMRQWVLSIPFHFRPIIANDSKLISLVGNVFIRSVNRWLRQVAREMGIVDAEPGSITFIQRFGGGLQLNPHFHALFMDGVYYQRSDQWIFHSIREPTKDDLRSIIERIIRLIKKLYDKGVFEREPMGLDSASQDPSSRGYVQFLGDLVAVPKGEYQDFELSGGLKIDGLSIHAKVATLPHQKEKLARLIRYMARGPIATERLSEVNGKIVYKMKTTWHNGADCVAFTKGGFIQRLIALIPPARSHLTRYHGVFAPHFKYRNEIVKRPTQTKEGEELPPAKKLLWAEMIAASFKVDVLVCRKCSGRMEPIAVIKDPKVAFQILTSMNLMTRTLHSSNTRGPPTDESNEPLNPEDQRPKDW